MKNVRKLMMLAAGLLFALTLAFSLPSGKAYAETSGYWTYSVDGSTGYASISAYSGSEENVTIPSTLGGAPVRSIMFGVFKGNTKLRQVTIPGTITGLGDTVTKYGGVFGGCTNLETVTILPGSSDAYIGTNTFSGCTALKTINIPANYTRIYGYAFKGATSLTSVNWEGGAYSYAYQWIGDYAFQECTALKAVSFSSVRDIGDYAFSGDIKLTDVTLHEGLITLGNSAFRSCTSLQAISIPSTVDGIGADTVNGAVFRDCSNLETVTIAEGSKDAFISPYSFYGCSSLKSIEVPANYTHIHQSAFESCSALSSVILKGTEFIDYYAFKNDTRLRSISLNEGLTEIQPEAFRGCTVLETITIPSTVTGIGTTSSGYNGAFYDCTSLKSVNIKAGTKDAVIGYAAFKNCTSLQKLEIPANYVYICPKAFEGDTALASLTWEGGAYDYAYQVVGTGAFRGCSNLLSATFSSVKIIGSDAFNQAIRLKNVTLNEGIITLESRAFDGCSQLESVTVPSTVTEVGGSAFQDCTKLKNVTLKAGSSPASLGDSVFHRCSALTHLVVPANYNTIGASTFANCSSLEYVVFTGESPVFTGNSFYGTTTTVYYPAAYADSYDTTKNYGGTLTWLTKPDKAGSLTVTTVASGLKLTWSQVPNVSGYKVYRKKASASGFTLIKTVTGTTWTDTTCEGGVVYNYKVRGYVAGNSNILGAFSAVKSGVYLKAPTLSSVESAAGGLKLTWTAVSGAQGYRILRKGPGQTALTAYATTKTTDVTWTDTAVKSGDSYTYQVRAYINGSSGNPAWYGIKSAQKTAVFAKALSVLLSPDNVTVNVGETAKFSVLVEGTDPSYQWQYRTGSSGSWKAATAEGNKTDTLKVPGTLARNGYQYRCKVSNTQGTVYSKAATLTVVQIAKPEIQTHPTDNQVAAGYTALFTVTARGDQLSYQWQYRKSSSGSWTDATAEGNKGAVLRVPGTASRNGYQYRCKVSNAGGTVYSNAATLTVAADEKPDVKFSSSSVTVSEGGSAIFLIQAEGNNLTYQWQYRTSPSDSWKKATASGNTSPTLIVPASSGRNGYQYRCAVSNSAGTVYSDTVTLTVSVTAGAAPEPETEAETEVETETETETEVETETEIQTEVETEAETELQTETEE